MNLLLVVLLLVLTCSTAAESFGARQVYSLEDIEQVLRALQKNEEQGIDDYVGNLQFQYGGPKFRRPRASEKQGLKAMCGAKLLSYVKTICSLTVSSTEIDIATKCCTEGCDDSYIKSALCPNE